MGDGHEMQVHSRAAVVNSLKLGTSSVFTRIDTETRYPISPKSPYSPFWSLPLSPSDNLGHVSNQKTSQTYRESRESTRMHHQGQR